MTQYAKAPAGKPEELSSILRPHIVEMVNQLP